MNSDKAAERKATKIEPGSPLHFALLGVPMGWNFLTGKDYADMQAFALAVWQAARASLAPQGERDLHAAIMNLPCGPGVLAGDYARAYRMGHKDARHAAAELALAPQPDTGNAGMVLSDEAGALRAVIAATGKGDKP